MERNFLVAFGRVIFLSLLVGCSSTHAPKEDETPPEFVFYLNIYPSHSTFCSDAAIYVIDPLPSSDNETEDSNLLVRWDFDSDGSWDTGFEEMEYLDAHLPSQIPEQDWVVTGEMKDEAGNTVQKTEVLSRPTWMPAIPDLVVGEIIVKLSANPFSEVDTLHASEGFSIIYGRRDWVNGSNSQIIQKYYVDNELVAERATTVQYPDPYSCFSDVRSIYGGIQEVGPHEIRVEIELENGSEETSLENNSISKIVHVVE